MVVDNLLRPVMIAGMLACLTAPLVYALQWLGLGYNANYFLIFAFLASLEGILSERVLQRRRITGWAYLGSRLSEAILLLLLLKLSTYLSLGYDRLVADAQTWLSDPYRFVTTLDLFLGTLLHPHVGGLALRGAHGHGTGRLRGQGPSPGGQDFDTVLYVAHQATRCPRSAGDTCLADRDCALGWHRIAACVSRCPLSS